jgi:hypothetical protein
LRRDRTFFFGLLTGDPHREGVSANGLNTITIPTPAGFAALNSVRLADGQTAQARQEVLSSLAFLPEIHAQARRYDTIRNVAVNGANIEFGITRIGQTRPSNAWNAQLRLDHSISAKDSISYFFNEGTFGAPVAIGWPFSNNVFGKRFSSSEDDRSQQHALSHTRVFTPALVNEIRLSASRHIDRVIAHDDSVPRTTVQNFFTIGPAGASPFVRPRNTYEAQNVLTWNRGRHSIKFGAHLLFVDDTISGTKQSTWTFNNFANFLNNQADSLTIRLGSSVQTILSHRQNYFVQDDIKLRPDVTVNIGLRYQLANLPEGLFGAATPAIASAGVPGPVLPDRNDVAPRFGFAYSPRAASGWKHRLLGDSATVLRGGYGIGYGLVYEGEIGATLLQLSNNYPWNDTRMLDRGQLINAFPAAPAVIQGSGFNPLATFVNYPENAKNPTTHFYSVSLQRQFAHHYIFEMGYLGSRSYHLYAATEHNPAILTPDQAQKVIAAGTSNVIPDRQQRTLHPEWGLRTFLETSAYSNYNAGYVRFDRRLSRGLLIGANYTWSATLGVGESDIRVQDTKNFRTDYARSAVDIPHRFVFHYVWQTPGRRIYGGWRISGVSQWQSGRPFSIVTGVDSNGDGGPANNSGGDRPNYNSDGRLTLDPVTGNWRTFVTPIDGTGIVVTPLGTNRLPLQSSMPYGGNLGRNTFRGPAFSLWNLSAMKSFRIAETATLEFRANTTNLFNHRNFGPPVASMNSVNFGSNTSTPPSRVVLLGAKLRF